MTDERVQGWERLLANYISESLHKPFVWGQSDCSLFAARWIDVSRETKIAEMFEGRYSTLLGAKKTLKEYSGGWIEETADKVAADFGFEEVSTSFSRRGDIMLVKSLTAEMGESNVLGINSLPGIFVQGLDGLWCVKSSDAIKAWRI